MTIRELAKIIDVSPATISIVLNGRRGVSEETRQKVIQAIEQYHYAPVLRSAPKDKNVLLLKFVKSGMLVEENQGFISMIVDAIGEQLRKEHLGTTLMLAKVDIKSFLASVDFSNYCGMILIASEITDEMYPELQNVPIPLVVVDNTVPNFPYNSVCMNNSENMIQEMRYLKDCGMKSIGYFRSVTPTENFGLRAEAFYRFVKDFRFEMDPMHEYRLTPTMLGAHDDMAKILEGNPKLPDCFFADNDTIALGAIKAMKEKGYKIPRDVSVVGFDDIPYASISSPSLTTVHVQRNIIGIQSVYQLLRMVEDPRLTPVKTMITGKLVIRGSVLDRRIQDKTDVKREAEGNTGDTGSSAPTTKSVSVESLNCYRREFPRQI